jgi:hypothetical protein
MPDAKIIQFPTGRTVTVEPITEHPLGQVAAFDAWAEPNVLALVDEIKVLETHWDDSEIAAFWEQARAMRELLNAWPIPD